MEIGSFGLQLEVCAWQTRKRSAARDIGYAIGMKPRKCGKLLHLGLKSGIVKNSSNTNSISRTFYQQVYMPVILNV